MAVVPGGLIFLEGLNTEHPHLQLRVKFSQPDHRCGFIVFNVDLLQLSPTSFSQIFPTIDFVID